MARKRRGVRNGQGRGRAGSRDTSQHTHLEQLRRSFAKFRRGHRTRARIPQALRDAALAVLQDGTTEQDVRRACSISSDQLRRWQQNQRWGIRRRNVNEQQVRVFPVVDEATGMSTERRGDHTANNLEFRVGRWSISIRQVEV